MPTTGEIAVHDLASQGNPQVDGIVVPNLGSNPPSGSALLQTVALRDGGGAANYQAVDSDGNAHTIVGRVSTGSYVVLAATTTPTQLLALRLNRVFAIINNQSAATAYIGFDSGLTAGPQGTHVLYTIPGGSTWNMPPGLDYEGAIYIVWDDLDDNYNAVAYDA